MGSKSTGWLVTKSRQAANDGFRPKADIRGAFLAAKSLEVLANSDA
jgi:hypothetical protein